MLQSTKLQIGAWIMWGCFAIGLAILLTYYQEGSGYQDPTWPPFACSTAQVEFIARVPGYDGDPDTFKVLCPTGTMYILYLSPVTGETK